MSIFDTLAEILFGPAFSRLDHLQGAVMGNTVLLTELADKVEQLGTLNRQANDKADALISLVGDLRKQVAELAGSGSASAAQLRALLAKVDAGIAEATAQIAEDEAALAEPPAPSPDPTPAPPADPQG